MKLIYLLLFFVTVSYVDREEIELNVAFNLLITGQDITEKEQRALMYGLDEGLKRTGKILSQANITLVSEDNEVGYYNNSFTLKEFYESSFIVTAVSSRLNKPKTLNIYIIYDKNVNYYKSDIIGFTLKANNSMDVCDTIHNSIFIDAYSLMGTTLAHEIIHHLGSEHSNSEINLMHKYSSGAIYLNEDQIVKAREWAKIKKYCK